jgi:hypothetical protein
MKKILALVLMTLSLSAMAQPPAHRHGHPHGHSQGQWVRGYGSGWSWGIPAVIGGLLVYEAVKQPVYVPQASVIVQQQPVYMPPVNPTCTPWTEVQSSDGATTRTRTCTQ